MANRNLLKILFVDDVTSDVDLAVLELKKEKLIFVYTTVCTRADLINTLYEFKPNLVISEFSIPSFNGLQALKEVKEFNPDIQFILYTGSDNEETAVECMKAGAAACVLKEHLIRLPFTVKEVLEKVIIQKEKNASDLLLRDNEEKLQSIFGAAPIGIGLVVERFLIEVNDTFCKMTGYTRNELIGKSSEMIYATREEYISAGIEKNRQISEKGMGSVETRFKCKNGRILNILLSAAPLDKDDITKGVSFTAMDITEQKSAAERLNKVQHLFETLALVSPIGIFRTDSDGLTTYVNPKWSELSGLPEEEAKGNGWLNAIHPDDRERLSESWLNDFKSKKESSSEYRLLKPDGSIIWVMGNSVPELIGDEVTGYIGTITDISKLKQSEETIRILAKFTAQNPDPVLRIDKNGQLLYANEASFELLTWKLHIGEKVPSFLQTTVSEVLKEGIEKTIETEHNQQVFLFSIVPIVEEGYTNLYGKDITKRKKGEEVLKESVSSLRDAQEIAKMGSWEWDLINQKNYWSDNNFAILGYEPGEVEPEVELFRNRIHPDDVHLFDESHVKLLKDKTPASVELRLIQTDGTVKWIQNNISPVIELDKIVKLKGISIDITERKQADDKLRSSEERLKILFDYAPDAFYLSDLKGNFIDGNIAAEKMLGYTKSELIGKNFLKLNLLSIRQLPKAVKLLVKNSIGQTTGPDDFRLSRKDGSLVNVEIITHPVKIKERTLVLGIARDISERKKAEKALQESEEQYRMIFENVQDLYYETLIDGTILEVSPSIHILTKGQYHKGDLVGKSIYEFYFDINERADLISKIKAQGTVTDFEIGLKNKDGSRITCSVSAKVCFDTDGRPGKIIGSMHDITDRKNASEKLKLAKEKAEASDKLKTAFLNNISHEVRTPLNGILGFAEIISNPGLSEEEKTSSFSMLHESSDRLLNTITNYMDISLITSGTMSAHKKTFFPGQILRKSFDNYKMICSIKNLELLLNIPEQSENLLVNSDPEIIQKIISHLLNNAVKFTEKGKIDFGYLIHDQELEFFVKDTGIGIGKESISTIFERFAKEDRGPTNLSEGSGLGLSIAKGMTDVLGGNIRVESERGVGSCFYFKIPVIKETVKVPSGMSGTDQKKAIAGASILVAEDDETNFFYLNAILATETGATILHAKTGKEAIELFKANAGIVLVLMDIKMPEIDGLEATKQIKLINNEIPVIAITAYSMSGDEERVVAAGCDGYLSKPISKKILIEKMAEFINIG